MKPVTIQGIELDRGQCGRWVLEHNQALYESEGRAPGAFVRTFGCQQNVSDSEKIKGMLAEMGYQIVDAPEAADFILFNTCAVRENAEDRVFGNVGALKHLKEQNPALIIGLCGCMMQQEHIARKIQEHYPYVDLVFGTHAVRRLPELVWQRLNGSRRVVDLDESGDAEIPEDLPVRRDGAVKAWVPIMYGCNNFCTYCVVPHVRGRERSREPARILEEVRGLVEGGYREIGLLGQNVNSYGQTLREPHSFARLLEEIDALPGEFRIRFMTSHPKDCTRELIDTIARCDKVCNHIHLPVQCGSDRVLKAMNRRYTTADYLSLIEYAKRRIPGVSFTSDIIVGFPGEREEDFRGTLDLVRRVGYQSLFTFLYSKRVGTPAADLPDDTPREVKMERFDRLLALQKEIGGANLEAQVGRVLTVLAEGPGKTGEGMLSGKDENGVIVEFPGGEELVGRFVPVRVTRVMPWAVAGEPEPAAAGMSNRVGNSP